MREQMLLHIGTLLFVVALDQVLYSEWNSMEHSVGDDSFPFVRLKLFLEGSIEDAPSRVEERRDDDCHFGIVLNFGRKSKDAFI